MVKDRLSGAARWILLLIGALIAAMVVVGYLILQAFSAGIDSREQAVLSADRSLQLRRIVSSAVNAETGQRGYLLTGEEAYLEPYYASRKNYPEAIALYENGTQRELTELQSATLQQLVSTLDRKFAELGQTIDLAKANDMAGAMALVNTDEGQRLIDEARDLEETLETEELRILLVAIEGAENAENLARKLLLFLGIVSLGVLPGIAYVFWRALRTEKAEHDLSMTNAEKNQADLLARELNHRVKNLFTIILSLIRQSGRSAPQHAEACEVIHDRVHALSLAHSAALHSEADERPVLLEDLVNVVLEPYAIGDNTHVLVGPSLDLAPNLVTPLSLIIHELATNSVKYGAWSTDGGIVTTRWQVEPDADGEPKRVHFCWEEQGGPAVDATTIGKDGFGSRMIQLSCRQIDGETHTEWRADGLYFEIRFDSQI